MKSDDELGMNAGITRRDLLHDAGAAALALVLGSGAGRALADEPAAPPSSPAADYPPTRTGLRGSHPGAFEAAHALAREGRPFPAPRDLDEDYDLVIVGAGISGLAAAHYYRERFGADSRILLLENHDDFGGHAKRNEFHQGGRMRLSLGGTHNLEWWNFSDTVNAFLAGHGVDPQAMLKKKQFRYGRTAPEGMAMWFDKERYGVDRLVTDCDLSAPGGPPADSIDRIPIPATAREQLKAFYRRRDNVLADLGEEEAEAQLRSISYPEFLRRYARPRRGGGAAVRQAAARRLGRGDARTVGDGGHGVRLPGTQPARPGRRGGRLGLPGGNVARRQRQPRPPAGGGADSRGRPGHDCRQRGAGALRLRHARSPRRAGAPAAQLHRR
jgi:spermidine dehydrogenase